jgi:hypothetical protein
MKPQICRCGPTFLSGDGWVLLLLMMRLPAEIERRLPAADVGETPKIAMSMKRGRENGRPPTASIALRVHASWPLFTGNVTVRSITDLAAFLNKTLVLLKMFECSRP